MKKAIIIAGQTGVGKTKIAYNLANKLNTEIICIDTIQLYKDLKICANKPSIFYTKNIKYHNLDILNLEEEYNGSQLANKTREIIKDIWSRDKIPILEGGCGFYLKMILSGGSSKFSPEEEKQYKKFSLIAKEIVKYDNNFDRTLQRISKLDKSTPDNFVNQNDTYRLEKRLTDALMFGDGAYDIVRLRESESRGKNKLDGDFYNFFLFCERNILRKKLEVRCEKMIQDGLIKEVSDLLEKKKITPIMVRDKNSIFLNAYGILETLRYFFNILKISHMKNDYLKAYEDKQTKKDKIKNKLHRDIEKIFYNYLNEFSISNRQYAKRQATWFKSNTNSCDFLWMDGEIQEEKIVDDIIQISNSSYKDYKNLLTQDDYLQNKNNYLFTRTKEYSSTFEMMKNRQIMKKILEKSFEFVEENKNILKEMEKFLNVSTKGNEESENKDENLSKNKDLDVDLLKKFLNM
jgi:tRNA dimethylallyltransferase